MTIVPTRLGSTWQSLGNGPLTILVLRGAVALQSSDGKPDSGDTSGIVLAASVGSAPTALAAGTTWWAKALVTETLVSLQSGQATSATAPAQNTGGAASSFAIDGQALAGLDLPATTLVSIGVDGRLRPASSKDRAQFTMVAGFVLQDVRQGALALVTRRDWLTNSAWTLRPGPVFVGENGAMTQTEPAAGFVQVAGLALSPTGIIADLEPPFLLSDAS